MKEYERSIVQTIALRLNEPRQFIQILSGPRQTGKSTAIRQALKHIDIPRHIALANMDSSSRDWLRAQWQQARNLINSETKSVILVVDEVQLIDQWSSVVKELWDEDSWSGIDLRVLLSGSSSLLLKKGLIEALTGRFEIIRNTHWSLVECEEAFGYSLDDFLYFGGYPGGAKLKDDKERWLSYISDSVIEPSISKDVVAYENVRKPALMRRLFSLGASYSGQELSYRKMLGQLDDAGNATTIAHYLELLSDAGLLCGISKYDPKMLRMKASSPRLMVYDTALMTASYGQYRDFLLSDPERKGHLVESAVGAHLLAQSQIHHFDVHWWREGSNEIDFIVSKGDSLVGIEVKSGRVKALKGSSVFMKEYPKANILVVGSAEHPLDDFLRNDFNPFR